MAIQKKTVKAPPESWLAQLLAVLEARTKLLAFFFGLCFVAALLVLAIWFPKPTPFQYTVFRITLALAASGVAGVIPGMIRLKVQPGAALLIHAGGALAVFVIVYLLAPAALPSELPVGDTKKSGNTAEVSGNEKQAVLINNNQGGNIQINNYGITKEQFEDGLKNKLEEFEKRKQNADAIQRVLLEQQIKELKEQLADAPKSYEEELKRRMAADGVLYLQNTAITLAVKHSDEEYQHFAANTILRWKQIYTDEEAFKRQHLAQSDAAEVVQLKKRIAETQEKLTQELRQPKEKQNIKELTERLNQDEMVMLTLAQHFNKITELGGVIFDRVLSNLPEKSGLIEYRFFQPVDFKTGNLGERHLAAFLLFANSDAKQQVIFRDLCPFGEIEKLLQEDGTKNAEIYNLILDPFDNQISNMKQLYIAPDGPLYLLVFASLRLPDGRFFVERQQINQLQTGRDLLADNSGVSGKGMVAIGGAKYGPMTADKADGIASSFYLPESRREAQTIGEIFAINTGETPTILIGEAASEYNLKHLKQPPRILHISTSSFYLAKEEKSLLADEAPLLLSGLFLAGANNGLQGKLDQHGDDGLLYSLEVLGLNLHGTELVSLSACETGKGVVDYSEGVYGLVRAFRTAGAKNVLMTLTPVGDASSRDFMETFYDKWLSSRNNISPAEALHQTRLQFIRDKKPTKDWAPYVLVGK